MMDRSTEILYLLTACQTIVDPSNEEGRKKRLAQLVASIADKYGLNLSRPMKILGVSYIPLFEACRSGNLHIVQLFLDHGGSLNVLDAEGRSPLYTAICSHHSSPATIAQLLVWGSDTNCHAHGHNPLLASFCHSKVTTSRLLIKKGANVNDISLPSFFFVASAFSFNSNQVMMTSGVRFQLSSFSQLLTLSYEIVSAGLHPRTFFICSQRFFSEGFSKKELLALWTFQHLCLVLGFRVDRMSLLRTLLDLTDVIDRETNPDRVIWMKERLEKLRWMEEFVSHPLPLTYLARIAIRGHLASPHIGNSEHILVKISSLPLPQICKDFLKLKHMTFQNVVDDMNE